MSIANLQTVIFAELSNFEHNFSKGIASVLTTNIFNKGRADNAQLNKEYWSHAQISAILDSRTCQFCRAVDGGIMSTDSKEYKSGNWIPPFHKMCRCLVMYISKYEDVKPNWKIKEKDVAKHLDIAHLKSLRNRGI